MMTTQIERILAQTTTKTSKIQQLLMLGLTRREVADLVTNGNYGFVYNVWKKMQEQPVTAGSTNSAFNRQFGIEIEAYNCNQDALARALNQAGIPCNVEQYNHLTRSAWKIVADSSLRGHNAFELVSPILQGMEGLATLKKVCEVLNEQGAKVNRTCGLHVHINARNFTLQTWKNTLINYAKLERNVIDRFMPASRRDNIYCNSLADIRNFEQLINEAYGVDGIRHIIGTRYSKVNAESYPRHGSIEFRQHGGTTSFEKISYWVQFLGNLITFAEQGKVVEENTISALDSFCDEDVITYLKYRTLKIKNDENN